MKKVFLLFAMIVGFASQSYASLSSSTAVSDTKKVYKYAQKNKLRQFVRLLDGDALLKYGSAEGMATIAAENDNYRRLEFKTTLVASEDDPTSMFPIETFNVAVFAERSSTSPIRTAQVQCKTRFHRGSGCGVHGMCDGAYYDSTCSIIGLDE